MAKDLRDLIDNAAADIDQYRHPNVDEAKERLTELLNAAGVGGIGRDDRIHSISEEDGELRIETSFIIRGCESGDSYRIPSAIIDSDDPIKAATEWGLATRIREAEDKLTEARQAFYRAEKKLADLRGSPSATTFETFKDVAGRLGWDTAQASGSDLGPFRDERLQTLWDHLSRNPAAPGADPSQGGSK